MNKFLRCNKPCVWENAWQSILIGVRQKGLFAINRQSADYKLRHVSVQCSLAIVIFYYCFVTKWGQSNGNLWIMIQSSRLKLIQWLWNTLDPASLCCSQTFQYESSNHFQGYLLWWQWWQEMFLQVTATDVCFAAVAKSHQKGWWQPISILTIFPVIHKCMSGGWLTCWNDSIGRCRAHPENIVNSVLLLLLLFCFFCMWSGVVWWTLNSPQIGPALWKSFPYHEAIGILAVNFVVNCIVVSCELFYLYPELGWIFVDLVQIVWMQHVSIMIKKLIQWLLVIIKFFWIQR